VARVTRRAVLVAGGGAVVAAGAGLYAWRPADGGADALVPDSPPGDERVERRRSDARGRDVDFYTAVPEGHGAGRGLPVCLVLHGASATAGDFPGFGLGRFLTAAVWAGAPPFVLAGATGDRLRWEPSGADDPQRLAAEEVPAWCAARGFDPSRTALWGWSMGGYGALRLAQSRPRTYRHVEAFSPAVAAGDAVFRDAARLDGTPVQLSCGTDDDFADETAALDALLPGPAAILVPGGHTRAVWNGLTPSAFARIGAALAVRA
jgi:predicted esterase